MEVLEGKVYRHFKGNLYQVLTEATHSESGERMVVYQSLAEDKKVYVRPYDMFISKVDKEKYPKTTQEYRFEQVDESTLNVVHPKVVEFLDESNVSKKLLILEELRPIATEHMIKIMAYSLDLTLKEGSRDEMFNDLLSCLSMRESLEGGRMRR